MLNFVSETQSNIVAPPSNNLADLLDGREQQAQVGVQPRSVDYRAKGVPNLQTAQGVQNRKIPGGVLVRAVQIPSPKNPGLLASRLVPVSSNTEQPQL